MGKSIIFVIIIYGLLQTLAVADEQEDKKKARVTRKYEIVSFGPTQSFTDNAWRVARQIAAKGCNMDVYKTRYRHLKLHIDDADRKFTDGRVQRNETIYAGFVEWVDYVGNTGIPKDHYICFYVAARRTERTPDQQLGAELNAIADPKKLKERLEGFDEAKLRRALQSISQLTLVAALINVNEEKLKEGLENIDRATLKVGLEGLAQDKNQARLDFPTLKLGLKIVDKYTLKEGLEAVSGEVLKVALEKIDKDTLKAAVHQIDDDTFTAGRSGTKNVDDATGRLMDEFRR